MIRIHIARARQPIGQFTPEEVAEGLKSGKFLPTDLGWKERMETWKPLGEFDDLPEVKEGTEPTEEPLLQDVTDEETPKPAATAEVEAGEFQPAWERRKSLGLVAAVFESIRQTYATPVATFRGLRLSGGYREPLTYYVLLASVSFWIALGYQIAVTMVNPQAILGEMSKSVDGSYLIATQIFMMVAAPLFIAGAAFVTAAVTHFLLQTFGGATGNFEATFRAMCYSLGPGAVLQVIPICGATVSLFVSLTFFILALRSVHGTDTWRSSLAVLLPTLICCGVFLGFYAVTVGSAVAAQAVK